MNRDLWLEGGQFLYGPDVEAQPTDPLLELLGLEGPPFGKYFKFGALTPKLFCTIAALRRLDIKQL